MKNFACYWGPSRNDASRPSRLVYCKADPQGHFLAYPPSPPSKKVMSYLDSPSCWLLLSSINANLMGLSLELFHPWYVLIEGSTILLYYMFIIQIWNRSYRNCAWCRHSSRHIHNAVLWMVHIDMSHHTSQCHIPRHIDVLHFIQ